MSTCTCPFQRWQLLQVGWYPFSTSETEVPHLVSTRGVVKWKGSFEAAGLQLYSSRKPPCTMLANALLPQVLWQLICVRTGRDSARMGWLRLDQVKQWAEEVHEKPCHWCIGRATDAPCHLATCVSRCKCLSLHMSAALSACLRPEPRHLAEYQAEVLGYADCTEVTVPKPHGDFTRDPLSFCRISVLLTGRSP